MDKSLKVLVICQYKHEYFSVVRLMSVFELQTDEYSYICINILIILAKNGNKKY